MYSSKIEQHYCVLGAKSLQKCRTWAQKGIHFGTLFFAQSAPWVPLGGSVSHKRGFGGGPKVGPKTGANNVYKMESFWIPFKAFFRDLVAKLSFLLKTHGAHTRSLILRAGALKIHNFWVPFQLPFWTRFGCLQTPLGCYEGKPRQLRVLSELSRLARFGGTRFGL